MGLDVFSNLSDYCLCCELVTLFSFSYLVIEILCIKIVTHKDVSQMVDCLPILHQAPGSVPSLCKMSHDGTVINHALWPSFIIPALGRERQEDQKALVTLTYIASSAFEIPESLPQQNKQKSVIIVAYLFT